MTGQHISKQIHLSELFKLYIKVTWATKYKITTNYYLLVKSSKYLKYFKHIHNIANKASHTLSLSNWIIKTWKKLLISFPQLQYTSIAWLPWQRTDIDKINQKALRFAAGNIHCTPAGYQIWCRNHLGCMAATRHSLT